MTEQVYKIALLGNEGVGKTALLVRFMCHRFLGEYDPTIEDRYRKNVSIDGVNVTLEILDTACRGCNSPKLKDQFLKEGDGFVVVYSTIDRKSYIDLPRFKEIITESRDTSDSQPVSVVLIGNKSDKKEHRTVTEQEGRLLADKYGWIFGEASATEYEAADVLFFDLVRDMIAKRGFKADQIHRHSATSSDGDCDSDSGGTGTKSKHSLIHDLFSSHGGKRGAKKVPVELDNSRNCSYDKTHNGPTTTHSNTE